MTTDVVYKLHSVLHSIYLALHGQMLSFNQLHSVQFPYGSSSTLSQFSRSKDVPLIKMPPAFIFAASGRRPPLEVNTTIEAATSMNMIGVVNMVMNNVEEYLPDTPLNETQDR